MKKSLLKSLTIAGLVLSFASCGGGSSSSEGPAPVSMTIAQATEWDSESSAPVNDGQLVTIANVAVNNKYGNTLMVQETSGTSLSGIHCVEVLAASANPFGWKDVVSVTGTVGSEDGRPVIRNAEVKYAVDEATSKGKGEIYGFGALTRAGFDSLASRSASGMLAWGGLVQLASLPGTVVAGTPSEFKVVFPGEKVEATNPIAIPVVIPALTEAEAAEVNGFFADTTNGESSQAVPAVVGDAFGICAPMYWVGDTVGFVFGPFGVKLSDPWSPVQGVFADWSEMGAEIGNLISSPLPDLKKDGTQIYSYVIDESSYMEVNDGFVTGLLVTAYTDDADADFTILKNRILADTQLDWTIAQEEEGVVVIQGATKVAEGSSEEPEVVSSVEIDNMGSYLAIFLGGVATVHDWASAIAGWVELMKQTTPAFETAIPAYADPAATDFAGTAEYYEQYGVYLVNIQTTTTSTYDYAAVLVAAGFVATVDGTDTYYVNETSGEVVYIDLSTVATDGLVQLQIFPVGA